VSTEEGHSHGDVPLSLLTINNPFHLYYWDNFLHHHSAAPNASM